jgi:hypothetical protein
MVTVVSVLLTFFAVSAALALWDTVSRSPR